MHNQTIENDIMTKKAKNSKDDLHESSFQARLENEKSENL